MTIELKELSIMEKQAYLQHAIAPRPIALASTMDKAGNVNLSPFSFFNLFSSNPPIIIFSPARKGRDNTIKHTLANILELPEVVIHIVDEAMVQQISLSSCEFPKGVNEFVKAGFTAIPSLHIRPPRVAESKIQMECKVLEVKSLGESGGAGQLVIAEVITMHIDDAILQEAVNKDAKPMIDQTKIHHVARLGADWYCKVDSTSLFQVPKPNTKLGIGVDALPQAIRESKILSGNDLGQLANVHEMPVVDANFEDAQLKSILHYYSISPQELESEIQRYAKKLLAENKVEAAWQVLLGIL
jgi:flavin reductase (DIM6/NTAB) family NADH-FMN oxidoreductase RutF